MKWGEFYLKRLIQLRWLILVGVTFSLLGFELEEHQASGWKIFQVTELYIFILGFLLIGILLELLAHSNRKLNSALKTLDYKHRLSSSLALETDGQIQFEHLAQVPRLLIHLQESVLLLHNEAAHDFIPAARWSISGTDDQNLANEAMRTPCHAAYPGGLHLLKPGDGAIYCLHIPYGSLVIAMLRFCMMPGKKPAHDSVEILNHLVTDMGASLMTTLERKKLAQLREAEAALSERRSMSRYLHDHISQNLGYLRLKLDQFSSSLPLPQGEDLKKDFNQMRDAANESYEIIRNSLENMQWTANPHLIHLIEEAISRVTQRTTIQMTISQEGKPVELPVHVIHVLSQIIREAFNNIEKYSGADKADIFLRWECENLVVTISDNGKGFKLAEVDPEKHFGLAIMRERVEELYGQIEICSAPGAGTSLTLWVPIRAEERV